MMRTLDKHVRNSGGFSLIELGVSFAIAILVSLVVFKFWITTSEAFTLDSNLVTIKQQSERALEIMSERMRRASAATIVVSNGNTTISFVDTSDGSNVQYSLNPVAPTAPVWGEIVQTINGGQNSIAGYVEALQFSVSGTGLVTITATFHKGSGRTETAFTLQSNASARN